MIFVTGGTGLLGSHLLLELTSSGSKVKAIKRNQSDLDGVKRIFAAYGSSNQTLYNAIEWVDADLLDYYSLTEALHGVTEVYHCAAMVSFHPNDKEQMLKINVEGTSNLVNACLESDVKKFCHVSSIAALGRSENSNSIDESVIWKSSKRNSVYSLSKYGAEREVWRGIAEGLNAVIVNPSVILGPGRWHTGSSELFTLVWKGLRFYTKGINGYVDVRDVARVMITVMNKELFGERYVVSTENLSYEQLFYEIATNLGKKPPSIHVNPFMGQLAWRFFAIKGLFSSKKPAITRETARSANNTYFYSSKKLQEATGFGFISIKQSISDISAIFLQEKQNPPVHNNVSDLA